MAEIIISGLTVLVDTEDIERILKKKWRVDTTRVHKKEYYFQCTEGTRSKRYNIYLHRYIMGFEYGDGWEVDHVNRNTLDNRKCNLRSCSRSQNMANTQTKLGTISGYRGVHYSHKENRWICHISIKGKSTHIGTYVTKEDAAKAFDIMAIRLYGEFATTNFDKTLYTGSEELPKQAEKELNCNNTSGYTGVSYRKDVNKWRARVNKNHKMINIGTFCTKEEAIKARKKAEILVNGTNIHEIPLMEETNVPPEKYKLTNKRY